MVLVWLAKILVVFNANIRPAEIAAGIAMAFLAALVPAGNLLWFGVLVLVFFIKINQGIFFICLGIFKLFVGVFDPILDALGYWFLTIPALQEVFISMANTPLVPWTKFNSTLVSGGLLFGLIAFIPLMVGASFLVTLWRQKIQAKIINSKIYKTFIKWPLISSLARLLGKILNLAKEFV